MTNRDERWQAVAAAIQDRIDELNLTKAEVLRASGLSDKTLDGYLRGRPIVRKDKARGLCEALQWPADAIERLLSEEQPVRGLTPGFRDGHPVLSIEPAERLAQLREIGRYSAEDLQREVERMELATREQALAIERVQMATNTLHFIRSEIAALEAVVGDPENHAMAAGAESVVDPRGSEGHPTVSRPSPEDGDEDWGA